MCVGPAKGRAVTINKMNPRWKWLVLPAAWGLSCALAATADAPSAYVLGPGDEIGLWALGAEEISAHPLRIDPAGFLDVPLLGHFQAGGLTVEQLREELTRRLQAQVRYPKVSISITDFRSQPVSVMGAVNKPGTYQLQGQKTLLEALSLAEGVRNDAGNTIRITRSLDQGSLPLPGAREDLARHTSVAETNLRDALEGKSEASMLVLRPHDILSISRAQTVYVIGEVHKAGGFALNERDRISVVQALALAQGLGPTAAASSAKILRGSTDGPDRKEIPVNIQRILDGKSNDIVLQPDDVLFVPNSRTKNAALRALETAINIGTGVTIWRVGYPSLRP